MGYNTEFEGKLKISPLQEPDILDDLEDIFGCDCREKGWRLKDNPDKYLLWIDLELNRSDFSIQWDGSEKSYGMADKIRLVIQLMHEWGHDNFILNGEMLFQGEDIHDRGYIIVTNNIVKEVTVEEYYAMKVAQGILKK